MIQRFKQNQKEARVHFIPDLKDRVFVTLRTPEVIKYPALVLLHVSTHNIFLNLNVVKIPDFTVFTKNENESRIFAYLRPTWFFIIMPSVDACLLYTSPSPRDGLLSRMP